MSARRVAVLIRSLGAGGGAERMMVNLVREFAGRAAEVDLVLGRGTGHFLGEVPPEVRVIDLGGPTFAASRLALRDPATALRVAPAVCNASPPWILGCIPALVDYFRRERPDALLSALNYTNIAALWARDLAGVPCRVVVSERNTLSIRAANESKRRYRVLPRLVRTFYRKADRILAVSDGVARDLERVMGLPRGEVTTTQNPVVTEAIERMAAAPPTHPWFSAGTPVLLGCGKFKTQKDFPTLLRAFALLRRDRDLRLMILGDGPKRGRLEALSRDLGVGDHLALPGFCANPFAAMAGAAAFVLSSAWEGLPNVLIEAMACGTPVISTNCPSGPAEILEGGAHGPLVPVGDARALAEAIGKLLDAPPPAGRLRARAADFDAGVVAERYYDALFPETTCERKATKRSAITS